MITLIFGRPGKGKTALMTALALEYMTGSAARQDVRACEAQIAELKAGGFDFTVPADHLVYSDYTIAARHGSVRSHYVNGFDLGLHDPNHFTRLFPPYSRFYLDEAQKYFNSRERNGIAGSVSRFYELHRHNHLEITLAVQRPKLIDLNVRELAERVIQIEEIHPKKDKGGRIVSITWQLRLFEKTVDACSFLDGGKVESQITTYTFPGNVFRHYNSLFHQPAFYNGSYGRDFEVALAESYPLNVDGVKQFNAEHSYSTPRGYFKGAK